MADYTINADENMQPEMMLTAGVPVTIQIDPEGPSITSQVQVMVHSGDKPVYVRLGDDVEVQGKTGSIVPPGTWFDIPTGKTGTQTISLVSAAAAVVSVYRS